MEHTFFSLGSLFRCFSAGSSSKGLPCPHQWTLRPPQGGVGQELRGLLLGYPLRIHQPGLEDLVVVEGLPWVVSELLGRGGRILAEQNRHCSGQVDESFVVYLEVYVIGLIIKYISEFYINYNIFFGLIVARKIAQKFSYQELGHHYSLGVVVPQRWVGFHGVQVAGQGLHLQV